MAVRSIQVARSLDELVHPVESNVKIKISEVTKQFKSKKGENVQALSTVNLDIQDGEFVTLVGPSGCGKTTLMRLVAGLDFVSTGHIDITVHNPKNPITSTVFQEESIFPWLDVQSNIEYGLKLRGTARKERNAISEDLIAKVGLHGFKHSYPHQLSGGMKQRVSVARAFANGSEVLLLDEPFGALDEQTRIILQEELLWLWSQYKKTVIFVTHSIDEAIVLSDRIIVMSARPGRIKEEIHVNLPRPRGVIELRANPHYSELYKKIWSLIRTEL